MDEQSTNEVTDSNNTIDWIMSERKEERKEKNEYA